MLHLPPTESLPAELGTQEGITPSSALQAIAGHCSSIALLLPKSQDINPSSPKSFRAVSHHPVQEALLRWSHHQAQGHHQWGELGCQGRMD